MPTLFCRTIHEQCSQNLQNAQTTLQHYQPPSAYFTRNNLHNIMDIDIEDDLFDDAVLSAAIAIVQEEVVRKQDRKQRWDRGQQKNYSY